MRSMILLKAYYRELVVTGMEESSTRRAFANTWKEHPPEEIQDTCIVALPKKRT